MGISGGISEFVHKFSANLKIRIQIELRNAGPKRLTLSAQLLWPPDGKVEPAELYLDRLP